MRQMRAVMEYQLAPAVCRIQRVQSKPRVGLQRVLQRV